jgi:type I restriction enzyme S subunit
VIANLKPYAAYKESGLTWLPELPDHWQVQRSKYLFREVDQRSTDGSEQRLSMSQRHGLIPSSQVEERRLVAESNVGGKVCQPGDLVLNRLKAHLGVLAVSPSHGVVSPDYTVLRPLGTTNHRYFCEVYRSPYCGQELRQRAKGIVEGFWRLYTDDFYDIRVPLPPPEEQAAIVRFLGWANGQLERAIRAKRKVIALLNEQKQAIIHRAVTRGLDPSVPLKQSGMPWLGEIPEHWDVRQMRHVGYLLKGTGGTKEDAVVTGVPCVRYGELYTAYRNFIRKTRTFVTPSRALQYTSIQYGDVLFAASGEKIDEIGKSAVNLMVEPAVCGGDIVILRPTAAAHAPFLGYACDSHQAAHQKATMCRGTTIKHIYPDELRGLQICFPPIEEQQKIAMALDANLLELNDTVGRMENEITLLREYRARLIADVVTGQLDVREAATHVPDDVALSDLAEAPDDIDDPETADEEAIS